MSDSEYSERKLENRFGENEYNKMDNLDELFTGMGLYWRYIMVTWKNFRAASWDIHCICYREVNTILDEQFSGNICDALHIWIKYLHYDIVVIN